MSLVPRRVPPPRDEEIFADWCVKIFRRWLNCPRLSKHGRRGQYQGGIDLLGNDDAGRLVCVQCKLRNDGELNTNDIDKDVAAALVDHPGIAHLEFATTQLRDTALNSHVAALDRKARLTHNCTISISFWGEIEDYLHSHPGMLSELTGGVAGADAALIIAHLSSMDAQLRIITASRVSPDHVGQSEIRPQIVHALEYVKKGQVDVAIAQLQELRERRWDSIDSTGRFQLSKALGNAYYAKEAFEDTATWFLEARKHSNSVEAQCLEARAYQYRDQRSRALIILDAILIQEPKNTHAHAVRLMIAQQRYAELLDATPAEVLSDVEVALALSYRAFDEGRIEAAVAHARTAYTASPEWHVAATHLGTMLLKLAHTQAIIGADERFVLQDRGVAEEAERVLCGALAKPELLSPYSRAMALYNRSSARKMLGRQAEGIEDLEEAGRLQPNDPQILATLGVTLEKEGNLHQAIRIYQRAVAAPEHAVGVDILLALALRKRGDSGDLDGAVGVLEQAKPRVRNEDEEHRGEYVRMLGQLRWQASRSAFSADLLPIDDLLALLTDDAAKVLKVWWLAEIGEKERAAAVLATLTDLGAIQQSRAYRVSLAEAYLKIGHPQRAVNILLSHIVTHVLTDELRLLLSAAQKASDDGTFLDVAERLRAAGVRDRTVLLIEAQLRHKYDVPNSAKVILGDWLQDHGDDRLVWMALGNIAIDTSDGELVRQCVAHLPEPESVSDEVLPGVLRLVVRSDAEPPGGARRYLYRLWRHHRRDPRTWQALLLHAYFMPRRHQEPEADPEEARVGVTVHLQSDGQPRTLCLEGGPEPDPGWDEFAPDSVGMAALLGKRCGQEVLLPAAFTARKAVIVRLSRNEDAAPARCLARWEQYFSHIPFIQEFRIPELPKDPTPEEARRALEPIIEMARLRRERAENVLGVYKSQPMPVWMIAKSLGLREIDALDALAEDRTTNVHCLGWNPNELAEQEQCLGRKLPMVVDMSAVATLVRLGVATEVLRTFELIAPERLLSELRRSTLEAGAEDKAEGHVVEQGGVLHFIAHESSRTGERRERLTVLLDDWRKIGRTADSLALAKLASDKRVQLEEQLVGPLTARALAIAAERSVPLLSDDMAVAAIGEQLLGITRISTAAVIEYLRKAGVLAESRASELLVHLHQWGYTGMPIRPGIFLLTLERAAWDMSVPTVRAMVDAVLQPSQAPVPVARFLAETCRLLWRRRPFAPDAPQVLQQLLQLLDKRSDGRLIAQAVSEAIDTLFAIDVLGAKEAKGVLQRWIQWRLS